VDCLRQTHAFEKPGGLQPHSVAFCDGKRSESTTEPKSQHGLRRAYYFDFCLTNTPGRVHLYPCVLRKTGWSFVLNQCESIVWLIQFVTLRGVSAGCQTVADNKVTWLILPVVICLSQRLSHACLSINNFIL
jgi:hypothetical protein